MSSETDAKIEALVHEWMYLPDISEQWGVQITEVRQMVKDRTLIAVRRGRTGRCRCRPPSSTAPAW